MTSARHPRLWVLIADGEHARVVAPTMSAHQFATVTGFDSVTAHQRSHDLGTDRPGRVYESASVTRHAIAPHSDPHVEAKHHFAQAVARVIDQHAAEHAFDQLVLVAPPHTLSDLRAALGQNAAAMVVGSEAKELTKLSDHELSEHLADWWRRP